MSIPANYNEDRLVLLVVNPRSLHTYWEVTPGTRENVPGQLILRTHGRTPEPYFFDTQVSSETGSWYLKVGRPDTEFYVELGSIRGGGFVPALRSNTVRTPPDRMAREMDSNWMSLEEVYLSAGRVERGPGSPDFQEQLESERLLHIASEAMVLRGEQST